MVKFMATALFSVCLFACTSVKKQELTTIKIDTENYKSGLFEDAKNVTKKTITSDNDIVVGQIQYATTVGDNIYMVDLSSSSVYTIDAQTCNIDHVLSKKGNSEEEYMMIYSATIDEKTKDIYVYDMAKRMLKQYSAKGYFIKNLSFESAPYCFMMIQDDKTILADKGTANGDGSGKFLSKLDKLTGKTTADLGNIPELISGINFSMPRASLVKYNSSLSYVPFFSNIVYNVEDTTITPKYVIDFGSKWVPDSQLEKFKTDLSMFAKIMKDGYVFTYNFLESEKWAYISFYAEDKYYGYFYSKDSGAGQLYDLTETGQPVCIDKNGNFVFVEYGEEDTYLVFVELDGAILK
ncbi:MAG: 6-bladed beta-propeller [Rikenellaceae bacterium]